jgi:hypothetical protein
VVAVTVRYLGIAGSESRCKDAFDFRQPHGFAARYPDYDLGMG